MAARSPYIYRPSVALACLGAITFVAIGIGATYRLVRLRSWVLLVFLFGIYLEAVGLVARAVSSTHLGEISAYSHRT